MSSGSAIGGSRISAGRRTSRRGTSATSGSSRPWRLVGLESDANLIRFTDGFTEVAGARACRALLDAHRDVTAIVAANDLIALGCYDALAERGLDCPADVSVVGFNDMPFADRFHPPLTTVRMPHREIGWAAAGLLLEAMADPDAPARQILVAPSLVVRESTAPPRR